MSSMSLKVIVELIDKLSGPAKSINDKLSGVGSALAQAEKQAEKLSAGSTKLQRDFLEVASAGSSVERTGRSVAAGLANSTGALEEASGAMAKTRQSASLLARSLSDLEKAGRGGSIEGVVRQQERLSASLAKRNVLEQRGRGSLLADIAGPGVRPRTSEPLHAEEHRKELPKTPSRVAGDRPSEPQGIGEPSGSTTILPLGMRAAGWLAMAYAAKRVVGEAARQALEFQNTELKGQAGGIPSDEWKKIAGYAENRSSGEFRHMKRSQIEEMALDARVILGNTDEALQILDPLLKFKTVVQSVHPETRNEDFSSLLKGLETAGATINQATGRVDPQKFHDYINGISRVVNTFSNTIPIQKYSQTFMGAGSEVARHWELPFITGPLATLLSESTDGGNVGKAFAQLSYLVKGGRASIKSDKLWDELGLLNQDKVVRSDKSGEIKYLKPGAILGADVLEKNPYTWMQSTVLGAMDKKGWTAQQKSEAMFRLFENINENRQMSMLWTQESKIKRDSNLSDASKDSDQQFEILKSRSTSLALEQIGGQLSNLGQIAASPIVNNLPGFLSSIAGGFMRLGQELEGKQITPIGRVNIASEWDGKGGLPFDLEERARRADRDRRIDPEAARGRAFQNLQPTAAGTEAQIVQAQPQTIDNSKHITAPITVSAPVSITVQTNASPAAIGTAVGSAIGAGVAKGAAALHDGPEAQ